MAGGAERRDTVGACTSRAPAVSSSSRSGWPRSCCPWSSSSVAGSSAQSSGGWRSSGSSTDLVVVAILLLPPIMTLFDRTVRRRQGDAVRLRHRQRSCCGAAFLARRAARVPDSGDSGHLDSALTTWTGRRRHLRDVVDDLHRRSVHHRPGLPRGPRVRHHRHRALAPPVRCLTGRGGRDARRRAGRRVDSGAATLGVAALWRSSHPGPSVVVTVVALDARASPSGLEPWRIAVLTLAILLRSALGRHLERRDRCAARPRDRTSRQADRARRRVAAHRVGGGIRCPRALARAVVPAQLGDGARACWSRSRRRGRTTRG